MKQRYLRNRENGGIYLWTEILSQLPMMQEVDEATAFAVDVEVREVAAEDEAEPTTKKRK